MMDSMMATPAGVLEGGGENASSASTADGPGVDRVREEEQVYNEMYEEDDMDYYEPASQRGGDEWRPWGGRRWCPPKKGVTRAKPLRWFRLAVDQDSQQMHINASGYCGAGGSMTERGTRATGSGGSGGQHPFAGMPPRPPAAAPGRRPSTRHQPLQARAAASSYSTRDEWLDDMLRASAEIAARLHSGTRLDVPPSPHPHPPEPQTFSPSSTFLTQTQDMDDDPGKARNGVRPVQRVVLTTVPKHGDTGPTLEAIGTRATPRPSSLHQKSKKPPSRPKVSTVSMKLLSDEDVILPRNRRSNFRPDSLSNRHRSLVLRSPAGSPPSAPINSQRPKTSATPAASQEIKSDMPLLNRPSTMEGRQSAAVPRLNLSNANPDAKPQVSQTYREARAPAAYIGPRASFQDHYYAATAAGASSGRGAKLITGGGIPGIGGLLLLDSATRESIVGRKDAQTAASRVRPSSSPRLASPRLNRSITPRFVPRGPTPPHNPFPQATLPSAQRPNSAQRDKDSAEGTPVFTGKENLASARSLGELLLLIKANASRNLQHCQVFVLIKSGSFTFRVISDGRSIQLSPGKKGVLNAAVDACTPIPFDLRVAASAPADSDLDAGLTAFGPGWVLPLVDGNPPSPIGLLVAQKLTSASFGYAQLPALTKLARAAGLGLSSVLLRLNEHGDPALAHDWEAYLSREVTSPHPLKHNNRRWGT